ncbi:MAG: hypothetical protein ACRD2L_26070, partial [Terriglobia bacterium]
MPKRFCWTLRIGLEVTVLGGFDLLPTTIRRQRADLFLEPLTRTIQDPFLHRKPLFKFKFRSVEVRT